MRKLFFAALAVIALALPARAQQVFYPIAGSTGTVGAIVFMCLNAQGQAEPSTAAGICLGGGGGGGGAATIANGADVAEGSTTDAPCTLPASGTACTMEALAKAVANATSAATPAGTNIIGKVGIDQTTPGTTNGVQVNAALPAGTNTIGNVGQVSQYPVGATALTASATGTTAATTATLAGTTGKTTYICGYSIRANATAAVTVTDTLTGVVTATMSSILWVAPLASGLGVDEQIFSLCIPASATNTGIAVVSGAPGSGGSVSVKAWGYQL